MLGVIDVANDKVETAEQIADLIGEAMNYVPKERLKPCANPAPARHRRASASRNVVSILTPLRR